MSATRVTTMPIGLTPGMAFRAPALPAQPILGEASEGAAEAPSDS
jgi:hypothetical protein